MKGSVTASPFLRVGHRGAAAHVTENTIEGFRAAIRLGANAVELDVRRAGDGTPVVIHDETLTRVFGRDLRVRTATLAELKDASGSRLPSLSEVLRSVGKRPEKILIELKEAGLEAAVIGAVKRARLMRRVIMISFHEKVLASIRGLSRTVDTGLIYVSHRRPVEAAERLGARYLLPQYRHLTAADVERAHAHGLLVIVWTANDPDAITRCLIKGVDGIASDRPDLLTGPGGRRRV